MDLTFRSSRHADKWGPPRSLTKDSSSEFEFLVMMEARLGRKRWSRASRQKAAIDLSGPQEDQTRANAA